MTLQAPQRKGSIVTESGGAGGSGGGSIGKMIKDREGVQGSGSKLSPGTSSGLLNGTY